MRSQQDNRMSRRGEWNAFASDTPAFRKQGSTLLYFLIFVFTLFIGILIFCYAATKRANPIRVDVNGKPVAEGSATSHH